MSVHLWWLHEINRIDKHQSIVPSFIQSMFRVGGYAGVFRSKRALKDGDYIRIRRQPEKDFDLKIGIDVAFEFASLKVGLNLDRLSGIHKFIREEVMPSFVGYFPKP